MQRMPSDWSPDNPDPGLLIVDERLTTGPNGHRHTTHPLANVSFHAVGRWYQREMCRGEDSAILRDLAIGAAQPLTARHLRIPTPDSGGVWVASMANNEVTKPDTDEVTDRVKGWRLHTWIPT